MTIVQFIGRSLGMRDLRDLNRLAENTDDWRMVKTLVKRLVVIANVPPPPRGVPGRRRAIREPVVDIRAFMFDWKRGANQTERVSVYVR